MKIFSAEQIKRADAFTITQEPVSSEKLMERAASRCAAAMLRRFSGYRNLVVVCGPGNNGGDGLVLARLLKPYFSRVNVFCLLESGRQTADFVINFNRLGEVNIKPLMLDSEESWHLFSQALNMPDTLIVDAIFGTGLSKPVIDSFYSTAISLINESQNMVCAIDIPSGMFADSGLHREQGGSVIQADFTFTFEQPKLSFMFAENYAYVGDFEIIPIGLHPQFKENESVTEYYVTEANIRHLFKKTSTYSHKGTFGHTLVVGGSKGKSGAVGLSAKAAARTGSGLVTVLVTEKVLPVVQGYVPEAMCVSSGENNFIAQIPALPQNITAIGIGPGLGTEKDTVRVFKRFLAEKDLPFVIDADGLNILSENKTWLSFLPPNSILTPHPKEFDRLTKDHSDGYSRWRTQIEFSKRYNIYVVLKGARTSITSPSGITYFNSTGNPGMATGGSGDVLTGILSSLLAQGYDVGRASVKGVYIHGLAGDMAYSQKGREALLASDIIDNIGRAFKYTFPDEN